MSMFERHYNISSWEVMVMYIQKFINKVTDTPISDNMKFLSKNNSNYIWVCKDSDLQGISVWGTEIEEEDTLPWKAKSTYGLAGKYCLDMKKYIVDIEKTQAERDKAKAEALKTFEEMYKEEKAQGFHGCPVSVAWYKNRLKEIENIEIPSYIWVREYTYNLFHIGAVLSYDEINTADSILDLHYTNGIFLFSVYKRGQPQTTRSIIFGNTDINNKDFSNIFIQAHNLYYVSDTKEGKYKDAFYVEHSCRGFSYTVADCIGESYKNYYTNDIFTLLYVKNEPILYKYSVNGEKSGLRWYVSSLYTTTHDESTYGLGEITSQMLVDFEYKKTYCSYTSEQHSVGAHIYPLMGKKSIQYEYDSISKAIKELPAISRTALSDSVNSTTNNVATLFPNIFYRIDSPITLDLCYVAGVTLNCGFVDTYNMSSGRIFNSSLDDKEDYACYCIYKRRMKTSTYLSKEKKIIQEAFNENYGFGGYTGLYIKVDRTSEKYYNNK